MITGLKPGQNRKKIKMFKKICTQQDSNLRGFLHRDIRMFNGNGYTKPEHDALTARPYVPTLMGCQQTSIYSSRSRKAQFCLHSSLGHPWSLSYHLLETGSTLLALSIHNTTMFVSDAHHYVDNHSVDYGLS